MAKRNSSHSPDEMRVRYFMAIEKSSRKCLDEIFTALYRTWGRGRNYESLREFCEECLGWRREDLANLLSDTHLQLASTSAPGHDSTFISTAVPEHDSTLITTTVPTARNPTSVSTSVPARNSIFTNSLTLSCNSGPTTPARNSIFISTQTSARNFSCISTKPSVPVNSNNCNTISPTPDIPDTSQSSAKRKSATPSDSISINSTSSSSFMRSIEKWKDVVMGTRNIKSNATNDLQRQRGNQTPGNRLKTLSVPVYPLSHQTQLIKDDQISEISCVATDSQPEMMKSREDITNGHLHRDTVHFIPMEGIDRKPVLSLNKNFTGAFTFKEEDGFISMSEGGRYPCKTLEPLKTLPDAVTGEPHSQESVKSVQDSSISPRPDETMDLSLIIQQANETINSRGHQLNVDSILCAEPCPTLFPKWVLLLCIKKIFPPLPSTAYTLLARLQRLYYVVCYSDLELDYKHLSLRLRILSDVISELISVVSNSCKEVIKRFTKETSDKLEVSKERLKSSQKEFDSHLDWVFKTRRELKEAEKDLHQAQKKSTEILRVYARSQSQESPSESCKVTAWDKKPSQANVIADNDSHVISLTDSGNASLVDEKGGRDLEEGWQEASNNASDSLLVSVMREVAVIQRKHNSVREFDKKFKKIFRRSQKSVIQTKREVRDRLDSNLSAEEDALTKEDIIIHRRKITIRLTKEIKRLRKELKALEKDEGAMIRQSTENLEVTGMEELDEESLILGQLGMQMVQSSEYGYLLQGTRSEARTFAMRVRDLDLGKWLMSRRYATRYIQNVYSRVFVPDCEDTVNILDVLGAGAEYPSIVVLTGPKGSGKSCMCQYLLHQWQSNSDLKNSRLHEFDLAIYCTIEKVLSSGSWSEYLREHIFCFTLSDFPESNIHQRLGSMTVLFLLDVGVLTPASKKVLKEIFSNLESNHIVVTARTGSESEILEVTKQHTMNTVLAKLCPMTYDAIEEYTTELLSNTENEPAAKAKARQFIKLVSSMKTTEGVLFPLPVAYLLYLWQEDPGLVLQASCLSRLFAHLLFVSECIMTEVLKSECGGDRVVARLRAEDYTQQLCEEAWRLVSGPRWISDDHILLEAGHDLLASPLFTNSFRSLIVIREGVDGKQRGILPHPAVADILCGFFLGYQKLSRHKGLPLIRRREKLERYCVPDIKRYRHILPHAAGALAYSKHTLEDSKDIATLYMSTLSVDRDMVSWLELLKECDYISSMCSAVAMILSRYSSWTVAHYTQETNCAVANLLRKGAYQPQQIIISQTTEGCRAGCGSNCVIRALSTCSSTLVKLRQESQFYSWGDKSTCDSLVVPLQPPGTLQECWGHLGVEGAMALRHSHHLEELNVRISSCEALMALTRSIEHLRNSLRYLFLRLDISPSIPASCFEPLKFKGRKLWLKLRGVDDNSAGWAMEVTRRLSSWYTEVLLEESRLSPANLHNLKQSLPHTTVHISC